MTMKSQIPAIVPVAVLVVATLAAGATMWHGLFIDTAARSKGRGAVAMPPLKAAVEAPTRKGASDAHAGHGSSLRPPTNEAPPR